MRRPAAVAAAAVALLTALTSAAPAEAAKPFVLDPSPAAAKPTIAVDSSGTAHIAWNVKGPVEDEPIVYCELPRNARSCSRKVTLTAPLEATSPPWVLLPEDGSILVVTSRCCSGAAGYPTYVFRSTDGGASFSSPTQVGDNEAAGDAVLGPGAFSLSTISDVTTGGVTFQTAPLAGPAPERVIGLGEIPGTLGADYSGTIGFVDQVTPLVAMDDLETVYFRRFSGGTNYNDAGSWGPLTPVGAGDEPQLASLASGKKGLHLLMRRGQPGKWQLVDRRYNGSAFGLPAPVSEVGDPIFHAFEMDPSGRLHAVWVDNTDDSLRYRTEPPGKGWGQIETLLGKGKADAVYDTRLAAARDGGGFVVWDANDSGPVEAIQFGPTGPVGGGEGGGGGACVDHVVVGGATVVAQEGCLRRDPKNADRYSSSSDVRINGIDLLVGAGPGGPRLSVDTSARTLTTSGPVTAKVGNVVLGRQRLEWSIPAKTGQITDLAGNPAAFEPGKSPEDVLGLAILGYTVPSLSGPETADIPVNLSLPAPFDSVLGDQATGSATLRTSNDGGLQLGGLKVHVDDVSLGIAQLKSFDITYVADPFVVQGSTDILLPPGGAELGAEFGLRDGGFDYGRGEFTFPPGQLAVATDILLRRITFGVQAASGCSSPMSISGGVTLTTGPDVAGSGLVSLDGNVSYSFPRASCGLPGVLQADGTGSLAGVPVSEIHARFTTAGQLTFGADAELDLDIASAGIRFEGGVDIPSKTFFAEGQGSVKAASFTVGKAEVIVSSVGMAGCGSAGKVIEGGFEYHWGEPFGSGNVDFPPDCDVDMGSFRPAPFAGARAAAAGPSVQLPGGLPSATIRLDGAGAPPGFSLTGPGGLSISYPSASAGTVTSDRYAVVPVGGATYVRIESPHAGAYQLTPAAGPSVTAVAVAHRLPAPSVKAAVKRGRGGRLELRFDAQALPGQSIAFFEEGGGVRDAIGATTRGKGVIRFRPAPGAAGRRKVIAIVSERGVPRATLRVGSFRARSSLPSRPLGVRLARHGGRLVVSWKRAPGAARVAVSYALADGRRLAKVVSGRSAVIGGVPGIDSGRILVAGLRRDGAAGKVVALRLKPHPRRLHGHRGRHPGHRHAGGRPVGGR